jgi:hypothetical protein
MHPAGGRGATVAVEASQRCYYTPLILLPKLEGNHFSHEKPRAGQPDPNGTANRPRISTPEPHC